ncbi:MAG: sodium/solute symporter [Planctomycetota bacterium]|nr:sodium/solute symporter [Planctomycetota bacterium]
MTRKSVFLLVVLCACNTTLNAAENQTLHPSTALGPTTNKVPAGPKVFQWSKLPPLPEARSGVFAGSHAGVLIVAGGRNEKDHFDSILVLNRADGDWHPAGKLPRPLSDGVSINTKHGLVCLGGCDENNYYREALLLRWDERAERVLIDELPSLPEKRAFAAGASLKETIFIAAGGSGHEKSELLATAWSLDLSKDKEGLQWKALPDFPGQPRRFAVGAEQDGKFLVFGGETADGKPLADAYAYVDGEGAWREIANLPCGVSRAASPAPTLGQSHVAIVGGRHDSDKALAYHTITDTWVELGSCDNVQDAPCVNWNGEFVIPGGRAYDGRPRAEVRSASTLSTTKGFTWIDYAMLGLYLATLIYMGFYFARREKSTEDFFLAGRRIPWWAAAVSIFATQLSAITYMATPAMVYRTNWIYAGGNFAVIAMIPVFVFFYMPFYRQLNVTTAYEYLEKRFNPTARLLGSMSFLIFQAGRMGVVLFLPAMALQIVTGMNIYMCIVMMGVLATVYTVAGGIEAVIWTDVLQVVVLMGGAALSLYIVVSSVDGGLGQIVAMGASAGKFKLIDWSWDLTTTSIVVVLVGRSLEQLISYGSDQTVVQRYLVTPDLREAQKSLWAKGCLTLVGTLVFFGLGTSLWAFYKTHPGLLNITGRTDDIFPWFIVHELPVGVSGLLIAGLVAASMSSLDSSMNSMATSITTDFYQRFAKTPKSERHYLNFARCLTVLFGVLGTLLALYFAFLQTKSMWDQYIKVIGLFGGGVAGMFVAGIFTRRVHGVGIVVGLFASALLLYLARSHTSLHFFLYGGIGIVGCVIVGYLTSLVLPSRKKDLSGLTIWTKQEL